MIRKIFIIFIIFYSHNLNATNIRVVDLDFLINKNSELKEFINKIEIDQKQHREEFAKEELNLKSQLEKIEEVRLILNDNEIQNEINEYNKDFNIFNNKIEKFNIHYENQLNLFKNKILQIILELLKEYSLNNKIDLILDTKSYIISDNSINITNNIFEKLDKISIGIDLEKFK